MPLNYKRKKKIKKEPLMKKQPGIRFYCLMLSLVAVALLSAVRIAVYMFHLHTMTAPVVSNQVAVPQKCPDKETDGLSHMQPLFEDLKQREEMFKGGVERHYWSEYFEETEKYHYRYSRARRETEYFIGRDDSGVVSSRFVTETGGSKEFRDLYQDLENVPAAEKSQRYRLWKNCKALGHANRGDTTFKDDDSVDGMDRCRVFFAMNTVGAEHGVSQLWETQPPSLDGATPRQWMSEQGSALMHVERNLQEINSMCKTGFIAVRVQILVCEPISDEWTSWMEAQVVDCEGLPWPEDVVVDKMDQLVTHSSPIQVVVAARPSTVGTCNNPNSGFMEKTVRFLALDPSLRDPMDAWHDGPSSRGMSQNFSAEVSDIFVNLKWSSLVTIRAVQSFMQASADLEVAGAYSKAKGTTVVGPSSGFLIPSFVRVAYVSEQDSNVAKWRMHGDFFHPAAWEINSKSFDVTWVPGSLAGENGVDTMCNVSESALPMNEFGEECGQHWVYMTESQMPNMDEVYADELAPPLIKGGSNHFWMLTARQRTKMIEGHSCRLDKNENCHDPALAVIPLGDLESFQINFTPNKAIGKNHAKDRAPGYSHKEKQDRDLILEKLKGKEEIEKAFFDYNVYSSALFRKDATLKAVRARDHALLSTKEDSGATGPQAAKPAYYDATITQPRGPVLGWCQRIARRGLCTLYSDYFRTSSGTACLEACGLNRHFSPAQ